MVVVKSGFTAALVGAIFSVYELCSPLLPKEVPPSSIGYVQHNTITSRGFFCCSAVIVDYNDKAVMAHALPEWLAYHDDDFVNTDNVVDKVVKELHRRNMPLDECSAIVDAGESKSLQTIVNDLHEYRIEIRQQSLADNSHPSFRRRDISYNPITDEKKTEYH